jgi:hypothetical protein
MPPAPLGDTPMPPAPPAEARYPRLDMLIPPTVDPLAAQMAQLLAASDVAELHEVVARWVATAVTGQQRRVFQNFGARLLELKQELARAPVQPTREELESMLTLMLRLAAESGGKAPPGP